MDWPFVYGHIATATGWTYRQIGLLTLWEVSELFDYWQDYPPTHVLVAGYLLAGNRKNGAKSNTASRLGSSFDELSQAVSLAGGRVSQKLPSVYKV